MHIQSTGGRKVEIAAGYVIMTRRLGILPYIRMIFWKRRLWMLKAGGILTGRGEGLKPRFFTWRTRAIGRRLSR
jgi:hypothetical protein